MLKFFKSKVGFTIVELMVVLLIMAVLLAVAIPAYRNVSKNSRIKNCCVMQRAIKTDVEDWCIDNKFNEDYIFQIVSSKEEETGYVADQNGTVFVEESDLALYKNSIFGGTVRYCPAGGTYTITVTSLPTGIPTVEVTCNGGDDGIDSHKEADE